MRSSSAAILGLLGALSLVAGCGADSGPELVVTDAATPDVTSPRDVPVARDVPAARDVVAPQDIPPPRDVVTALDAPPPSADRPSVDVSAARDVDDLTPDLTPDGGAPVDVEAPPPTTGATLRVTASALNLRTGAGTSNAIVTAMPCGASVTVIGGPTTGWWNVRYGARTGWASGAYLVDASAFDPATCGGEPTTPPTTMAPEVARIFELARSGVGYSYYWGHGSWGTDGRNRGSCSGSCPSCTHSGRYGADCSGFVAKVWQIPSASPVTTDAHPYSTYNFYNSATRWSRVSRGSMRPGDALVYNASGSGHIVLYESGSDPWGSVWLYEARGCATGIVHNLRAMGSSYVAIRREGL